MGGLTLKILDNFWYGNIAPDQYDTSCEEYRVLLNLLNSNEEKLTAILTDEQKELFQKYTDSVREFHAVAERLLFKNSFSFGAKMMLEIMEMFEEES